MDKSDFTASFQYMESKNLSIMITDIQGYSKLSTSSSRKELLKVIQTHNKLLKPVIEFYKGSVIKSLGDSLLCRFESATDAAVCAIAIQIIIQEYNKYQEEEDKKLSAYVS